MRSRDRRQREKDEEGSAKSGHRVGKREGELDNRASVPRRVSRLSRVLSGRAYIEVESGPWNKTTHPR